MIDRQLRTVVIAPAANRIAGQLAARGVQPGAITALGFAAGVGASVGAGLGRWWIALALWIVNRTLDGLDGPLARMRGATDLGGYIDLMADFAVYAAFVIGIAIAVPDARLACACLLGAYYVNGAAWLAYSSLVVRREIAGGDDRSLRFVPGIAEGAETAVAYLLVCVLPSHAATLAWVFTGVVLVSATQRLLLSARTL